MSDFHSEELIKKSRKEHTCLICGGLIPKGSSYYSEKGCMENSFYSYSECVRCNDFMNSEIREILIDDNNCVDGNVLVHELIENGYINCPKCGGTDMFDYKYLDKERTKVKFICEDCEREFEVELTVESLLMDKESE